MQSSTRSDYLKKKISGFSLAELLVSVSIVVVITAVIVFNQNSFADRVSLMNSANEIELTIREAQTYGTAVREFQSGSSNFNYAYGVVFNTNTSIAFVGPQAVYNYISFIDSNPDRQYNLGGTSFLTCDASVPECIKIVPITRGNRILSVCAINSVGTDNCSPTVGRLDVMFLRPNTSPIFRFKSSTGADVTSTFPNARGAKVIVVSPKGIQKSIIIYANGQVSII